MTIVLVIAENAGRNGRYSAWHEGDWILTGANEPFLDAARVLLARGLDPDSRYVMRRSADGPDVLVSTLGQAAKLMVEERGNRPPRFLPFRRGTRRSAGARPCVISAGRLPDTLDP